MTEKEMFLKLICNPLEGLVDKDNFFTVDEEENEIIVIGDSLQEICFKFDKNDNLVHFY